MNRDDTFESIVIPVTVPRQLSSVSEELLKDYFAAQVMSALIIKDEYSVISVAKQSYEIADTMMLERKK